MEASDTGFGGARLPRFVRVVEVDAWRDTRGSVIVPAADDLLRAGQVRNLHVVVCHPGTVRGNHLHRNATEALCVLEGHFIAYFEDPRDRDLIPIEIPAGRFVLLEIQPGIAHAVENVGRSDGLLLCYADRPFAELDTESFTLLASPSLDP